MNYNKEKYFTFKKAIKMTPEYAFDESLNDIVSGDFCKKTKNIARKAREILFNTNETVKARFKKVQEYLEEAPTIYRDDIFDHLPEELQEFLY